LSVGALLLRGALGVWFPTIVPFVMTFPAVLAATLLCGRHAGLVCLALTQVGAWYLFLPPQFSFDLRTPSDGVSLVISTLCALLIVGFADRHVKIVARIEASEREAAERRLKEHKAERDRLQAMFDQAPAIISLLEGPEHRFALSNQAHQRLVGRSDLLGLTIREAEPGLENQGIFDLLDGVFSSGIPHAAHGVPIRYEREGGKIDERRLDFIYQPVLGPDGEITGVFALATDVTERFESSRRLAQSEAKLRELNAVLEARVAAAVRESRLLADLVEGTDAGVLVIDNDYRLMAVNRAALIEFKRVYGLEPRVGDHLLDLLADRPEHQAAVRAAWERVLSEGAYAMIAEFGDPDYGQRHYELRFDVLRNAEGDQIGAYQFGYDVTERIADQRRLASAEAQLRQSQKMEAMGQLTGGVAHDFNNLLTPIMGALDLLQRKGLGGERERRLIEGAMQSAERARLLVQRLLAFARRQPLQPSAVDIGVLVSGMADLIGSTMGPQIRVSVDLAPDLPAAHADAHQLEMALLNLSVNARDAIEDNGVLRITASPVLLKPGEAADLNPGRYIRLSVSDTGSGMDEATIARAVEPFFSTKGVGKGTGLGLSMVHGLAQQLGGALRIHSQVGVGTNVELWLPASHEASERAEREPEPLAQVHIKGSALLVDDEDLVRECTASMLHDLGYSVIEARSAEEALSLMAGGLRPDVVITDHLMPGMTGAQLAHEARTLTPGLPVLLLSGYADIAAVDASVPILTKPFLNADLASRLATIR
jgi:signal transduction histidine kinase/CheY-like chemotaxis protein